MKSGDKVNPFIADIIIKMVEISKGNVHDIEHFLKVYTYAKAIGEKELSDDHSLTVLETASIIHDIACPLCRIKYGKTDGNLQELESPSLVKEFLNSFHCSHDFIERVCWLVAHHHTYSNVQLMEHRILLEADFLVNASESNYSIEQIKSAKQAFFRTNTGITLLNGIYFYGEESI
jgi:HD superfamily phosphodiesterase